MVPEQEISELKNLELKIKTTSGHVKMELQKEYDKLKNRVVDILHMELGRCATRYRAAKTGTEEDKKSLEDYYRVFQIMYEINGGYTALDPDAELPDELMPSGYVEYWLNYPVD